MELVFGFLPLPVAAGALVVVGVATFLVNKFVKNKAIIDATNALSDAVITQKRIDQTVEAVLAKLKVDPTLADHIGDLIAEVVVHILGKAKLSYATANVLTPSVGRSDLIGAAVVDGKVDGAVVTKLISQPTDLTTLVHDVSPVDLIAQDTSYKAVVAGVVKAYADNVIA